VGEYRVKKLCRFLEGLQLEFGNLPSSCLQEQRKCDLQGMILLEGNDGQG